MSIDDTGRSGRSESPILVAIFRLAVPALLGAILTYAGAISSAQTELSKALYSMQGQLATIVQQNSDYVTRLSKVERAVEENRSTLANHDSRLSVIESRRTR